jgi:hypothetical protein
MIYGRESFFYRAGGVDEVVGDYTEPDPAIHSDEAFVSASVESVPPLGHADAALASGPPFLAMRNRSAVC